MQKHAATRLHYDFRLEFDGALKSWAVPKGPSLDPGEKRLAVHVEDHPLDYASFEGIIPKGSYGAGEVIVWDAGTYVPDEPKGRDLEDREAAEAAMREGLEAGKMSVTLLGKKLRGSWALVRMKGKDWLLIKHADSYADPGRDILEDDRSIRSGATLSDLRSGRKPDPAAARVRAELLPGARAAPFPNTLTPMLPTLAEHAFSHPDWIFEPKLDGIRVVALVREEAVKLLSRLGSDATSRYPALIRELGRQEREMVLDGEIVALDPSGKPSFQLLQERMHLTRAADIRRAEESIPIVYYVFDLLYADGYELHRVPLRQRRLLLESTLALSERVRLVDFVEEEGEMAFEAFVDYGLEGVVAKRRDSFYEPGRRSHAWLKIKGTQSEDFVVVGFTAGAGARAKTFGALVLAAHDDEGKLRMAGQVGSGFDDRTLEQLRERLDAMVIDESPVAEPAQSPTIWVRPELVAEVKFTQWTNDGRLRAPVFLRLREDKAPGEAVRAEPVAPPAPPSAAKGGDKQLGAVLEALAGKDESGLLNLDGHRINLTHLNKVLWPPSGGHAGVTKRDLLRYFAQVSPYLLDHLKDRPLSLVRCPDGITGERFFQKHVDLGRPKFVETVRLFSEHNVGDGDYVMCNNLATLMWFGQMAALEIHPWYSRVSPEPDGHHLGTQFAGSEAAIDSSLLNYPDFIVFDLDPYIYSGREGKGEEPELNRIAYQRTCEVAYWLKELLDGLDLKSFVKTSGRTGLHIFAPILRQLDYDTARSACETIGTFLRSQHPKDVTMEWTVTKRTGKVFFDHNQNVRGKTLAAAFSPRLAPEATISMPLDWSELLDVYPTDFAVLNAGAFLEERGDRWADISDAKTDVEGLLGLAK